MTASPTESVEVLQIQERMDFGRWRSRWDYTSASLALCIGLGSLWRFPYVAYECEGGSFFWVYTINMLFIAGPLYLYEVTIGQLGQMLHVKFYKYFPMSRGVGLQHALASLGAAVPYHIILSYTVLLLYHSVMSTKEWRHCTSTSSEMGCIEASSISTAFWNDLNVTVLPLSATPEDFFWIDKILGNVYGFFEMGAFSTQLLIASVVTWSLLVVSILTNFRISGRFTLPMITILVLTYVIILQNAVSKRGALSGLLYLFLPKMKTFFSIHVWREATIQAFYSLSLGTGAVLALANHNPLDYNIVKTNLATILLDYVYTVATAVIVFSVIGNVSVVRNVPIPNLYHNGLGLVFTTFPRAAAGLWMPQLWVFIFFSAMTLQGLQCLTALWKVWIRTLTRFWNVHICCQGVLAFISFLLFFALTLPALRNGGIFYAQWIDVFCGSFPLLVMVCYEVFYYRVGYGKERYSEIIHYLASGFNNRIIDAHFAYFLPTYLLGLCLFGLIDLVIFSESMYWETASWSYVAGWAMFALLPVPSLLFSIMWYWKRSLPKKEDTAAAAKFLDAARRKQQEERAKEGTSTVRLTEEILE